MTTTNPGEEGHTTFGGYGRVPKTLPQLGVCGELEEVGAVIGAAITAGVTPHGAESVLREIQDELADLVAALSSSRPPREPVVADSICERYRAEVPAGFAATVSHSGGAGLLCLARAVTRRAERSAWALVAVGGVDAAAAVYLNRLADALLLLAYRVELAEQRSLAPWQCPDLPNPVVGPR